MRYTSGANTYDASYYYDAARRLTKLTDWIDGTDGLRYAYDAAGRMTRMTDYDDSHLDYAYDAVGNVTSMNDYHSNITTYTYTDTNQVSTITAPGSMMWTYAYSALGQPTSVSIPNGMTTEYAYDTRNRLTSIEHKDGTTVLDGFTYARTAGGSITATTHQDSSKWEYEYDDRERLTKAERYDTDGSTLMTRFTYTYDDADNMLSKVVYDARENPAVTTTTTFAYDAANELTSSTTGGTATTYAYDAWGRMTSKGDGTYTATYAYRYGDKLCSVTSDYPTEGNVTYEYGADGKRRSRVEGTDETWYNWAIGWNVISEEDDADGSNGGLSMSYIVDKPRAEVASVLADLSGTNPATGTVRYYNHDNLGSSRRLRDATKGSLGQYEYAPYGSVYAQNGAGLDGLGSTYTGKSWDAATQLYYFPYRYYSPASARWLTRDPLGIVDGPNVYTYVSANPISQFDPLGLVTTWEDVDDSWTAFTCICGVSLIIALVANLATLVGCAACPLSGPGVLPCYVGCLSAAVIIGLFDGVMVALCTELFYQYRADRSMVHPPHRP